MMKMQMRSGSWINIWQCFKNMGSIITSHKCQSGYEFVDDASAVVHCLSVYIPHRAGCLKASGAHQTEIRTFSGSLNWDSPHSVLSHFLFKAQWAFVKTWHCFQFGRAGTKVAFKVQAQRLGRQMKQLHSLWACAFKPDQDVCLFA